MNIPGLDTQFYYGAAGAPPPDWRAHADEEEDDSSEDAPNGPNIEIGSSDQDDETEIHNEP